MKPESLPAAERLRKTWQYQRVYKEGRRLRGSCFTLISAPNEEGFNRLGISVYGFKSAVRRNRVKRVIREFYRRHKELVASCALHEGAAGSDIVFTVRHQFTLESPAALAEEVGRLAAGRRSRQADG